jgi:hypothetical protein
MREIVTALENDDRLEEVVFGSGVDGFFLNHSDFLAKFEDPTSIPQGPSGLEAWPDVLVRLTRAPFAGQRLQCVTSVPTREPTGATMPRADHHAPDGSNGEICINTLL